MSSHRAGVSYQRQLTGNACPGLSFAAESGECLGTAIKQRVLARISLAVPAAG